MENSPAFSFKNINRRSTFASFLFMAIGILLAHQTEVTAFLAQYLNVPIDVIGGAVGFIFYVLRKIVMPSTTPITNK